MQKIKIRWALSALRAKLLRVLPRYQIDGVVRLNKRLFMALLCVLTDLAYAADSIILPDASLITRARANAVDAIDDHRVLLKGDVHLWRGQQDLRTDQLEYDSDIDQATAQGNVRMAQGGLVFKGPKAQLLLDANEGSMDSPHYWLTRTNGRGQADKILFLGENQYRAENATYSTCSPDNMSWFLRTRKLDIDDERKIASGDSATLVFLGVPVSTPSFSLPLSEERRSGFLAPLLGLSTAGGVDMTLPYYVNIASNRDFIFKPRLLSKRGMQLATEFRYLAADYNGVLQAEYLPEDRIARRNRWFYNVQHSHQIGPDWKTYINAAKVSDDNYPGDLGQSSSTAVQQQFTQELGVSYTHGNWTTLARVQKFQTLAPNPPAVNRVPQLNVLYRDKNVEGWVFQAETDVSQFKYPVAPVAGTSDGMRVFVKPELRYVWRTPNYFVIPKISLNASAYDLSQPMQIGGPTSITRTLPSVSVDAGLAFVRAADEWTGLFGRDIEQTLEPRIFYVYTPFRDQSQIPIFDTASADFNLTQIFSEQPFYGNDRIADNNKVTVGVTSRLLALAGGEELASFTLAQRFDMQGQRVTINSTNYSAKQSYSDVLAGASVNFFSDLSLGSTVQYTLVSRQLQASNLDLSWKPGQRRVLNFSYSYQRPNDVIGPVPLRQIVASGQWPVFAQFDLLARANYDRAGRKMVDSMLGLQYDAGCWIGRFVVQRFTNLSQRTNTNFFFQVEFKGLSQGLGSANNIFKLYVPGYTPLSARPADLSSHEINY